MCDVLVVSLGYWILKVWEYVIINNMLFIIFIKNIKMYFMVECKVYNKIVFFYLYKIIVLWNVIIMV